MQRREHEVAGKGRFDSDLCGLVVPDLTEEYDVRVGSKNRAKGAREGEPGFGVHLNLVDSGHPVFDRIFDGDDVDLGPGYGLEGRVQSRRLSRAGRTGDEDHPVGLGIGSAEHVRVAAE